MKSIALPQLVLDNPFGPPVIPERMMWTQSSIKLFRKCKRKFFWKYIMRMVPRTKAPSLLIGGTFHDAVAHWYKAKRADMVKIADRYVNAAQEEVTANAEFYKQDDYEDLTADLSTLRGMLIGYAGSYHEDRHKWKINPKHIEASFKVDCGPFDFVGKVDLLTTGKPAQLVEHKTASKIPASYIDRLPMDTQVRGYTFGAVRGLGVPVNEVLYDVVRKCQLRRKKNESIEAFSERIRLDYESRPYWYFFRETLKVSMDDVRCFEHELHQTHKEFEYVLKSGDPTDPRTWTPNDSTCSEYFRTCEYFNMCTVGLDRGTGSWFKQNDVLHEEVDVE